MCGIAGIYNLHCDALINMTTVRSMVAMMRHRGPDGTGFYRDRSIGLGHARLSIIDPTGGSQPMQNEDGSLRITFNGEIFNYKELRGDLEKQGHHFRTDSDTEVIVHAFEQHGTECLRHLNGQFAFGIWDRSREELFIARDRVGIRPLYYTVAEGQLLFASEIKALFADIRVRRGIDLRGLDQICTFWMTAAPRTAFEGVLELPAGHYLKAKKGSIRTVQYWEPDFRESPATPTEAEAAEELRALLIDATRLQLRADVPVGSYLSGGIDSSVITALIRRYTNTPLRTFSVSFAEGGFDESAYQAEMVRHLGADHSSILCTNSDIGRVFPDVVWHTEKPLVRTAPAPLFLLSKLVHQNGYKVVLTGEGADEILAGYDLFKEVKVREFLLRRPGSRLRPLILKKLYPYLELSPVRSLAYAEAFFGSDRSGYPAGLASHAPRWKTASMIKMFYSDRTRGELQNYRSTDELSLLVRNGHGAADTVSRAQYIEMKTLLPGYLLSSQGDRVAMAHSVEGRFPFLDHRVIEFCNRLPPRLKLRALTEKYLLKKSMHDLLPRSIVERKKQPYRAPDAKSFFQADTPGYVEELLSERSLRESGYFDPKITSLLVRKCASSPLLGFKDNMAIVFILSTLLIHDLFIVNFHSRLSSVREGSEQYADHAGKR